MFCKYKNIMMWWAIFPRDKNYLFLTDELKKHELIEEVLYYKKIVISKYIFIKTKLNREELNILKKHLNFFIIGPCADFDPDSIQQKEKYKFSIGSSVRIIKGIFKDTIGVVEKFDKDKSSLQLSIKILGRPVTVSVHLDEIE